MARAAYINDDVLSHILAALTRPNRLAVIVSATTGLRIGDVLNIRTCQLSERFTVTEQKTGKHKLVRLSPKLLDELLGIAGKVYVFENRCDYRKHRTRQAVYKDIRRAARLFRLSGTVSPHSVRKLYAVREYKRTGSIAAVRQLLNHSSEAVTMVYALADELATAHQRS